MIQNIGIAELFPAKAQTSTLNGTGVDLQPYINAGRFEIAAYLNVGAASGTTPTLDVKLQESDDDSTYSDITGATFTQATAVTSETIYAVAKKRYVRAVATIAGSTPSFTMAVVALATKRAA